MEITGYDAWKLETPEEDYDRRNPGWKRRQWEEDNADALRDEQDDYEPSFDGWLGEE